MAVEPGERLETFVWAVVVDEPAVAMISLYRRSQETKEAFYIPRTFGENEDKDSWNTLVSNSRFFLIWGGKYLGRWQVSSEFREVLATALLFSIQ
jgi:hypothetical protein